MSDDEYRFLWIHFEDGYVRFWHRLELFLRRGLILQLLGWGLYLLAAYLNGWWPW